MSVPTPAGYVLVWNYRSRDGSISCHVIFNNRKVKQYLTIAVGNVRPGQYADDVGLVQRLRRTREAATIGTKTYSRVYWTGVF